MYKLMGVIVVTGVMSACSSMETYVQTSVVSSVVSIPLIGEETTVAIGEQLLAQGTYAKYDVVTLNTRYDSIGVSCTTGDYRKKAENNIEDAFVRIDGYASSGDCVNSYAPEGGLNFTISKKTGEVCVWGESSCNSLTKYSRDEKEIVAADSLQRTLIYNGKIGDIVSLGYREFSDRIARSAFSNEVKYDLSVSNVISYGGAKIEVLDADNNSIQYKILSNFN